MFFVLLKLRNATAIDVTTNQIVSTNNKTARKAAEELWDNHVGEAQWYETEVGKLKSTVTPLKVLLLMGMGR